MTIMFSTVIYRRDQAAPLISRVLTPFPCGDFPCDRGRDCRVILTQSEVAMGVETPQWHKARSQRVIEAPQWHKARSRQVVEVSKGYKARSAKFQKQCFWRIAGSQSLENDVSDASRGRKVSKTMFLTFCRVAKPQKRCF